MINCTLQSRFGPDMTWTMRRGLDKSPADTAKRIHEMLENVFGYKLVQKELFAGPDYYWMVLESSLVNRPDFDVIWRQDDD